ncbi:hypothetical protein D3C86_2258770 [compost metagenome]
MAAILKFLSHAQTVISLLVLAAPPLGVEVEVESVELLEHAVSSIKLASKTVEIFFI